MTTVHVFLFGLMVALTPSLLVLAWALWRAPLISSDEQIPALSAPRGEPSDVKRRRTRRVAVGRFRRPIARRKHIT